MKQIDFNSNKYLNFKSAQEVQIPANAAYQIPQMMPEQSLPDVQLPDIYEFNIQNIEDKSVKKTIKKFDMMNLVMPWIEHPLLAIPTCAGLMWGVDKFSDACSGEYEKSLLGKASNLGTKIQESKFSKSKPIKAIRDFGRLTKIKIKKLCNKSDLLSAIWKTPSRPEWTMPKDEMHSMQQRVVRNFTEIPKALKLTEEGAVALENLHIGNKEKEFLKNFFGSAEVTNEMKSNALQLKNLGLADDAIKNIVNKTDATDLVKTETLKKMGLTAEKVGMDLKSYFEKLAKGNIDKQDIRIIREACDKGRGIAYADGHSKYLGPLQILKRKVGIDEFANRLTSMTQGKSLGKSFSSFLQKCHRGFFFGGGRGTALLWVTPMLVDTMIDVKKAEPKDKVGTAAHGAIHAISWVFTFPLALKAMHRLGGMQYAGMGKKKVEKARLIKEQFNKRVTSGEFKNNRIAYDKALKWAKLKVKALERVKDQNLLTKIGRKIGKFITMDLETFKGYNGGNFLSRFANKIPNSLKNIGGVPIRLVIWGLISMGVLDAIINKGIKTFFGGHYDRFKDEENKEAKIAQKKFLKSDLKERLKDIQREKIYGATTPEQVASNKNRLNITSAPQNIQNAIVNNTEEAKINSRLEKDTKVEAKSEQQKETTKTFDEPTNIKEQNKLNSEINGIPDPSKSENIFSEIKTQNIPNSGTNIQNTPIIDKIKPLSQVDSYNYLPKEKSFIKQNNRTKRDSYTYIPSSENIIKKEDNTNDVNKYIPSQIGAKFNKTFDNSGLDAALKRADRAERRALQTLAGNFNAL